MRLVMAILILMSIPFAAHADFAMNLKASSFLCTGTGVKDSVSTISLALTPSEGASPYSGTYKIDQAKPVSLSMSALSLQSEGSILIQTYGKYAQGQNDYLNLMVGGTEADQLAQDLDQVDGLKPVYKFDGFISFNRETRFKVSCLGSFVK